MQIDIRRLFKDSLDRFYDKDIQIQQMKSGAVQFIYNPTWLNRGQGYTATVYVNSYTHGGKLMYKMSDDTTLFRYIYHSLARGNFTRYAQAATACSVLGHHVRRTLIYDKFMAADPIVAISSDLHTILNQVSRYFYWSQALVCASAVAIRESDDQEHQKKDKAQLAARKAEHKAEQLKEQRARERDKAKAQAERKAKANANRMNKIKKQFIRLYHSVMAMHRYDSKHFGRKSGKVIPKALLLKHARKYLDLVRWSAVLENKTLHIKPHTFEADFPIGTTRAQHLCDHFSKMPDYKTIF